MESRKHSQTWGSHSIHGDRTWAGNKRSGVLTVRNKAYVRMHTATQHTPSAADTPIRGLREASGAEGRRHRQRLSQGGQEGADGTK